MLERTAADFLVPGRIYSLTSCDAACGSVPGTNANQMRLRFPGGTARQEDGATLVKIDAGSPRRGQAGCRIYEYIRMTADSPLEVIRKEEGEWILGIPESVVVCGTVSFLSFEKAAESMRRETEGKTFDQLAAELREIWNAQLGKARVEGNTREKQRVYYTALYRAFMRSTDYTEYRQYFSAYGGQVHDGVFYTGDGLWDTFRCMHPLQLLLDPVRHRDILESYNLMYRQSGLMPSFPGHEGNLPVMLGFHAASLFADAFAKGVQADYETAYEGIRKTLWRKACSPGAAAVPWKGRISVIRRRDSSPPWQRGKKRPAKTPILSSGGRLWMSRWSMPMMTGAPDSLRQAGYWNWKCRTGLVCHSVADSRGFRSSKSSLFLHAFLIDERIAAA